MRYFDTSALVKQYLQEAGSKTDFRTSENRREGLHGESHVCRDACSI